MEEFHRYQAYSHYSPREYSEFLRHEADCTKIKRIVDFTTHCYTCENTGIEHIRTALISFLARCNVRCGNESLLTHMLRNLILQKPQLGVDLIRRLGDKNLPLMQIMKFNSTQDVLVHDTNIMLAVLNSLAPPSRL